MGSANVVGSISWFYLKWILGKCFPFGQGSNTTPGLNFAVALPSVKSQKSKLLPPSAFPALWFVARPHLISLERWSSSFPSSMACASNVPFRCSLNFPVNHAESLLKLPSLFCKQPQAAVVPTWPFKSQAVTSPSCIIDVKSLCSHDRQLNRIPTARRWKRVAPGQYSQLPCEWALLLLPKTSWEKCANFVFSFHQYWQQSALHWAVLSCRSPWELDLGSFSQGSGNIQQVTLTLSLWTAIEQEPTLS